MTSKSDRFEDMKSGRIKKDQNIVLDENTEAKVEAHTKISMEAYDKGFFNGVEYQKMRIKAEAAESLIEIYEKISKKSFSQGFRDGVEVQRKIDITEFEKMIDEWADANLMQEEISELKQKLKQMKEEYDE